MVIMLKDFFSRIRPFLSYEGCVVICKINSRKSGNKLYHLKSKNKSFRQHTLKKKKKKFLEYLR